jgi:hypothetical protein
LEQALAVVLLRVAEVALADCYMTQMLFYLLEH